MAIAPVEVFDSFSRTQNGIGVSDSGHHWSTSYLHSTLGASVSGNHLTLYQKVNTGGYGSPVPITDIANENEREVLVRVKHTNTNDFAYGPMLNWNASTGAYYAVRMVPGAIQFVVKDRKGNFFIVFQTSWSTPAANTWFWVRFRQDYTDNLLKVRTWAQGTAEPTTWTFTSPFFDGAYPPNGGTAGMWTQSTGTSFEVDVAKFYTYNLNPDTEPINFPITDGFDRAVLSGGWGMTDTKQLWRGHVADDPAITAALSTDEYTIDDGSGGRAALNTLAAGSADRFAWLGPTTADMENYASFSINATGASIYLGVRGAFTVSGGNVSTSWNGYFLKVPQGSTSLVIGKAVNGTTSTLATATLGAAVAADTVYWGRFQVIGSTLQGRVWKDGTTEPTTWQVSATDTTFTTAGVGFYRFNSSSATNFRLWSASIGIASAGASNYTTTGACSVSFYDDLHFQILNHYSNDANNNVQMTTQGVFPDSSMVTVTTGTVGRDTTAKTFSRSYGPAAHGTTYHYRMTFTDPDGVAGTNPIDVIFTTPSNGVTSGAMTLTPQATSVDVLATYSDDFNGNATAQAAIRTLPSGSFGTPVTMTVDRTAKQFTANLAGLASDTSYEVQVTYADADGVYGTNPLTQTVTTLGKQIDLLGIGATTTDISAVIAVQYDLDLNENSTCALRYRSIRDRLFTSVNPGSITVDRVNKEFRATLVGLVPNMSYEVVTDITDPDGVVPGSSTSLSATFTTKSALTQPVDKRGKHYIYRVYDDTDTFVGTWPDADDPQFSWDENGGVSELQLTLPHTLAQVNKDLTIYLGNRVDVWVVDGESKGMGPNLVHDGDMALGAWTLPTNWSVAPTGGPDDTAALKFSSTSSTARMALSEVITIDGSPVPLAISAIARASGGKLRLDIAAYDSSDTLIMTSDDNAETVGTNWQQLYLEWLPPIGTSYVRIRVENVGSGTMYVDKVACYPKEYLIYRGLIETFDAIVDDQGERVQVTVLGLQSVLSDDYIEFLQYDTTQTTSDLANPRYKGKNRPPTDPASMLKDIIDTAAAQNPKFKLFYTADSIKPTGLAGIRYTFREKLIRDCFDDVRKLCPANWSYFIAPSGCVYLRGPEHVATHKLRLSVEVIHFHNEQTVSDLKNVIILKGRQDADNSEPDGNGSIYYVAQDPVSVKQRGRRVEKIDDSNVRDPQTAEIMAEGRLEELNIVGQTGVALVPDEKDLRPNLSQTNALRGYNVQAFQPGDLVVVTDVISGPNRTYWDQFTWDNGEWDDVLSRVLPPAVPIRRINYQGTSVELELAQRQPTTRGAFAKMIAIQRRQMETEGH